MKLFKHYKKTALLEEEAIIQADDGYYHLIVSDKGNVNVRYGCQLEKRYGRAHARKKVNIKNNVNRPLWIGKFKPESVRKIDFMKFMEEHKIETPWRC